MAYEASRRKMSVRASYSWAREGELDPSYSTSGKEVADNSDAGMEESYASSLPSHCSSGIGLYLRISDTYIDEAYSRTESGKPYGTPISVVL